MKKGRPSKMEMNKTVRQILARYRADMTAMQVFCSPSSINMTGTLLKIGGGEFGGEEINGLKSELEGLGSIVTDLTNWDLTGGSISRKDKKGEKESAKKDEKEEGGH